ncbi:potassium-transporting ATPase subunit KdpB [Paraburkholderia hiiakae]|nr:potassium-transporting ATPase subunit KdpB [Paraburkholderia hiiakae]
MRPVTRGPQPPHKRRDQLFDRELVRLALRQAFIALRPDIQWKNPVMFVVEIGAVLTFVFILEIAFGIAHSAAPLTYFIALDVWLFLTVVFANFATAIAEERGKAQADTLRRARRDTSAFRLRADGTVETVASMQLRRGDVVIARAGDVIPGDGEVIEGTASVDESAITGESAPVIRDAGGDRSGVTGGTTVLSDEITVRISADPGETFLDRMIALVEGAVRQRTPNEIALTLVLSAFTLIFLIVVVPLWPMAYNAEQYMTSFLGLSEPLHSLGTDVPTLVALLVCLIPTTIGALLAAIGIAGMDRALRANIIAKSGKAVEVAGDIDTVVLDKTGTITMGNRRATAFMPVGTADEGELKRLAALASFGDLTPEGKSIAAVGGSPLAPYAGHSAGHGTGQSAAAESTRVITFSAQTRMSGVDLADGHSIRKGAPDAVIAWVREHGGEVPFGLDAILEHAGAQGATPIAVANGNEIAGVVLLEDILKPGIRDRIQRLRAMGLYTVMVTGDNALTAATIARLAGVDHFIAQATPEAKLAYLRAEQGEGKLVAMMGDGTNDAPALAQADVGLAMNSGTQAAKEAGNMVDLDSDPTKLIEVVEIGKQLLMTRGALTTFSIANDVAKYFAIVPALFAGTLPWLGAMDVMHLHSPTSAILSAVIFNALIIPLLIPVALKGVRYRALGADALLRRNLLIWGLGGVIVPFAGIKLIDVVMTALGLVS